MSPRRLPRFQFIALAVGLVATLQLTVFAGITKADEPQTPGVSEVPDVFSTDDPSAEGADGAEQKSDHPGASIAVEGLAGALSEEAEKLLGETIDGAALDLKEPAPATEEATDAETGAAASEDKNSGSEVPSTTPDETLEYCEARDEVEGDGGKATEASPSIAEILQEKIGAAIDDLITPLSATDEEWAAALKETIDETTAAAMETADAAMEASEESSGVLEGCESVEPPGAASESETETTEAEGPDSDINIDESDNENAAQRETPLKTEQGAESVGTNGNSSHSNSNTATSANVNETNQQIKQKNQAGSQESNGEAVKQESAAVNTNETYQSTEAKAEQDTSTSTIEASSDSIPADSVPHPMSDAGVEGAQEAAEISEGVAASEIVTDVGENASDVQTTNAAEGTVETTDKTAADVTEEPVILEEDDGTIAEDEQGGQDSGDDVPATILEMSHQGIEEPVEKDPINIMQEISEAMGGAQDAGEAADAAHADVRAEKIFENLMEGAQLAGASKESQGPVKVRVPRQSADKGRHVDLSLGKQSVQQRTKDEAAGGVSAAKDAPCDTKGQGAEEEPEKGSAAVEAITWSHQADFLDAGYEGPAVFDGHTVSSVKSSQTADESSGKAASSTSSPGTNPVAPKNETPAKKALPTLSSSSVTSSQDYSKSTHGLVAARNEFGPISWRNVYSQEGITYKAVSLSSSVPPG